MSAHLPITVTLFPDREARTKNQRDQTIAELTELIASTTAPSKQQLPWLKLALFGDKRTECGSLRHDANVDLISGVEVDYDGEVYSVDAAVTSLTRFRVEAIVYTSPSHSPEKPRWRVLCPFDGWRLPEIRTQMVDRLNGALSGVLAAESWTLSQAYYYGSVNGNPHHRVEYVEGGPLNFMSNLDEVAIGRAGYSGGTGTVKRGDGGRRRDASHWRGLSEGVVHKGGREAALTSIAGMLLRNPDVPPDQRVSLLRQYNARHCRPRMSDADIHRIARIFRRYA